MSETTGLSFENQRFDHQRLTSSGSANSSLEDDTSKLWTLRDKNVSFWGPDRLLFYIVAKFGLRKADWVDEQSLIQTAAFIPDVRTAGTRKDGGKETSVNWEDDAHVESFTLSNKNNAQHGAARISTLEIVKTSYTVATKASPLSCERRRLAENQYHGNIVYSANVSNRLEKMLAAALALKSRYVPPR